MMANATSILIIDDEEGIRNVLSELMSDEGHTVSSATTGQEALAMFTAAPVPLVICDLRLPDTNGLDLIRQIKAISPDTQIIIITSYASLDSAVDALRSGAYDYLTKPFEDLEVIISIVRRAIEKLTLVRENRLLMEKLTRQNEELEQANAVLRQLAVRDGLTGLYNHRYLQEALTREISRSARHKHDFSILFLDVDHFKCYNDTHGHPQGDELLRQLSHILAQRLRQSDLAARYGGEEFVMLLPETNHSGAFHLAESICQQIAAQPFFGRDQQPHHAITVSIGVATYPGDGATPSELIATADQRLYRAKDAGRNRVY